MFGGKSRVMEHRTTVRNSALLPVPRTRMIGREQERENARTLLLDEAAPLLTMTGPGGSGKTRLALAIARDVADHFAAGVIWVDLAPLADASLVPDTVVRALGLVPVAGLPIVDQLVWELRPRQSLLLLDNCEHLVNATSELAASLLTACPALQILATSRAPLHLRGEHELPLEPFPLPAADAPPDELFANEAVQLFVERAQAVAPQFALTESNTATIVAICRRLDGLPLVIELAAARIKMLSPEALLAQMVDRLRLLRGGPRDLPLRQQAIRDTIAWSYALLAPAQQALFRRLSVFAGGWQLEAAAFVSGAEGDALGTSLLLPPIPPALLDEASLLVDQSLVRRMDGPGEPHFNMLETIREFGLERLAAAGEDANVRNRHAEWFRSLVDALDLHHTMQGDVARMSRLVPEQDNLRQALAWFAATGDTLSLNIMSAALSLFWPTFGQFSEARRWLQVAIANDACVPVLTRARALNEAGWLAMCQGDLDLATPLRDQGLALAREAGDPYLLAEALLGNGTLAFWQGDLDRAAALTEEARSAFQAMKGDFAAAPVKAGAAVNLLGNIALIAGDTRRAVELGEEAVEIAHAWRRGGSRLRPLWAGICAPPGTVRASRGSVLSGSDRGRVENSRRCVPRPLALGDGGRGHNARATRDCRPAHRRCGRT